MGRKEFSITPFLKKHKDGFTLAVRVKPRAANVGPLGEAGGELKWGVACAAEGGKANEELRAAVAKYLGISQTRVHLMIGEKSRSKVLLIEQSLAPRT